MALPNIKPIAEFIAWLDGVTEKTVRGMILAKVKRLKPGLLGDVGSAGEGFSELRIHIGAGWRVHFVQRGLQVVVLLADGSKRTRQRDTKHAEALAASLD